VDAQDMTCMSLLLPLQHFVDAQDMNEYIGAHVCPVCLFIIILDIVNAQNMSEHCLLMLWVSLILSL